MQQWHDQLRADTVPHEWWPWIAFAPFVGLAVLGFGIWYLYRIIRGLVHALESKPY
jgi:uncharacterized membrane protein